MNANPGSYVYNRRRDEKVSDRTILIWGLAPDKLFSSSQRPRGQINGPYDFKSYTCMSEINFLSAILAGKTSLLPVNVYF
jgi:hypothetical protein